MNVFRSNSNYMGLMIMKKIRDIYLIRRLLDILAKLGSVLANVLEQYIVDANQRR
jgi:hypothetical protein